MFIASNRFVSNAAIKRVNKLQIICFWPRSKVSSELRSQSSCKTKANRVFSKYAEKKCYSIMWWHHVDSILYHWERYVYSLYFIKYNVINYHLVQTNYVVLLRTFYSIFTSSTSALLSPYFLFERTKFDAILALTKGPIEVQFNPV